ncbi:MAG: hypothetical protein MZV65_44070 [Chromatiales bacterium]|nr:hypothetical protein [Chromatiales bacterium]
MTACRRLARPADLRRPPQPDPPDPHPDPRRGRASPGAGAIDRAEVRASVRASCSPASRRPSIVADGCDVRRHASHGAATRTRRAAAHHAAARRRA